MEFKDFIHGGFFETHTNVEVYNERSSFSFCQELKENQLKEIKRHSKDIFSHYRDFVFGKDIHDMPREETAFAAVDPGNTGFKSTIRKGDQFTQVLGKDIEKVISNKFSVSNIDIEKGEFDVLGVTEDGFDVNNSGNDLKRFVVENVKEKEERIIPFRCAIPKDKKKRAYRTFYIYEKIILKKKKMDIDSDDSDDEDHSLDEDKEKMQYKINIVDIFSCQISQMIERVKEKIKQNAISQKEFFIGLILPDQVTSHLVQTLMFDLLEKSREIENISESPSSEDSDFMEDEGEEKKIVQKLTTKKAIYFPNIFYESQIIINGLFTQTKVDMADSDTNKYIALSIELGSSTTAISSYLCNNNAKNNRDISLIETTSQNNLGGVMIDHFIILFACRKFLMNKIIYQREKMIQLKKKYSKLRRKKNLTKNDKKEIKEIQYSFKRGKLLLRTLDDALNGMKEVRDIENSMKWDKIELITHIEKARELKEKFFGLTSINSVPYNEEDFKNRVFEAAKDETFPSIQIRTKNLEGNGEIETIPITFNYVELHDITGFYRDNIIRLIKKAVQSIPKGVKELPYVINLTGGPSKSKFLQNKVWKTFKDKLVGKRLFEFIEHEYQENPRIVLSKLACMGMKSSFNNLQKQINFLSGKKHKIVSGEQSTSSNVFQVIHSIDFGVLYGDNVVGSEYRMFRMNINEEPNNLSSHESWIELTMDPSNKKDYILVEVFQSVLQNNLEEEDKIKNKRIWIPISYLKLTRKMIDDATIGEIREPPKIFKEKWGKSQEMINNRYLLSMCYFSGNFLRIIVQTYRKVFFFLIKPVIPVPKLKKLYLEKNHCDFDKQIDDSNIAELDYVEIAEDIRPLGRTEILPNDFEKRKALMEESLNEQREVLSKYIDEKETKEYGKMKREKFFRDKNYQIVTFQSTTHCDNDSFYESLAVILGQQYDVHKSKKQIRKEIAMFLRNTSNKFFRDLITTCQFPFSKIVYNHKIEKEQLPVDVCCLLAATTIFKKVIYLYNNFPKRVVYKLVPSQPTTSMEDYEAIRMAFNQESNTFQPIICDDYKPTKKKKKKKKKKKVKNDSDTESSDSSDSSDSDKEEEIGPNVNPLKRKREEDGKNEENEKKRQKM